MAGDKWTGGAREQEGDEARLKEFESRIDPNNKEQLTLLEEMRAHTEKLAAHRKNEDPRLSFTTPEFKEASRIFTENFKVSRAGGRAAARPGRESEGFGRRSGGGPRGASLRK